MAPGLSAAGAVRQVAGDAGRGLVNFGKRTVHGLTGAFDPRQIGMHSGQSAEREVKLLQARHNAIAPHLDAKSLAKHEGSLASDIASARATGAAGERAINAGVTSIPGVVRGLASSKTRGATARELGHQMTGGALLSVGGALGVGVPTAIAAGDLVKGDESGQGGLTVGQKLRHHAASIGVGGLTAGLPLGAQFVAGSLTDAATSPRRRAG